MDFQRRGKLTKGCNSTLTNDPLTLNDYRPISLVCCQYKIISKALATRLQSVLPNLISENQTAFVSGWQIIYGALITNEVVSWAPSGFNLYSRKLYLTVSLGTFLTQLKEKLKLSNQFLKLSI